MQRVAALYDIHGNLPALQAVMDDVRRSGVDAIVVGGDVLPGPMPRECLDLLTSTGIRTEFIHGNGETAALEALRGGALQSIPEAVRPWVRWSASQLPNEQAIATWPLTVQLAIDGVGRTMFCHATPRNDTEIITRLSSDDRIREVFEGAECDVAVCGHTHMQFDRRVGSLRVVNAGSVGMPFGPRGAYWVLLGPDVELRHTDYDLEIAAARLATSGLPGVSDFIARQLRNPATEEQVLAAYASADSR